MGEIENIGRRIERDSATDIRHKLAHSEQVQQEVADLYHSDPAKFQSVLKFMANDTENLNALGLRAQVERSGNDITGLWFKSTRHDGAPDTMPSFLDTESFRHFLTDPNEQQESISLANAFAHHDYGSVQAYLDANKSDPAKLARIFESFDVLNQNAGLTREFNPETHTLTMTASDMSMESDRPVQWPSVTIPARIRPTLLDTDFQLRHKPGEYTVKPQ
jgi:hypothetical protein